MSTPSSAAARGRRFYAGAAVVLFGGWVGAALLYAGARDEEARPPPAGAGGAARAYGVEPRDSKQYRSDVENVGGQAALLTDQAHSWLAGLWRPRQRSITLAAAASAVAALLFLAGWRSTRAARRTR